MTTQPTRLVKLTPSGTVYLVDLNTDGSLVERSHSEPAERWAGEWTITAGRRRLSIRGFELAVQPGSSRATEYSPDGDSVLVRVLPATGLPATDLPAAAQHRADVSPEDVSSHAVPAAIKLFDDGRIYCALLHGGGVVEEFDLEAGSAAGTWSGRWSSADGAIEITVGGYGWTATDTPDGLIGTETASNDEYPLSGCLVAIDARDFRGPLFAPQRPLFSHEGYDFFGSQASELSGYFSDVIEARRSDRSAWQISYAAKVVRPGSTSIRDREFDFLNLFAATNGLIARIDAFDLPTDPRFGAFAGGHVILLEWGTTDLKRRIDLVGRLDERAVLELAVDLSYALVALHTRFSCVHSDVKPANIIGVESGSRLSWRLADFNVTSEIDAATGTARFHGGTTRYMSPELSDRLAAGVRTTAYSDDVWAAGVVLFEAAMGGDLRAGERAGIRLLDESVGQISASVERLIRACWSPERSRITAAELHRLSLELATPSPDQDETVTERVGPF